MQRHKSRPYNPDIANTFFRAGYVETWGRGIQKICEACRKHGTPEPEYEVLGGDITVNFTALQTAVKVPKSSGKCRNTAEILPEQHAKIYDFIISNGRITSVQVEELLNVKERRARAILNEMLKAGVVKRFGATRNLKYVLDDKDGD